MLDTGKLDRITDFSALLTYLEDELDWPINANSFEDLTYDYTAAELGLQDDAVGGAIEIKQMRPLTADQPWGIFFLGLPQKTLPVTVLRRILGKLAVKKRASANAADRAAFNKSDLLFIAATGAGSERRLAFAHFHEDEGDTPVLKVLGWDADDTVRKLSATNTTLKASLVWPAKGTNEAAWRIGWANAFTLTKGQVIKTSKDLAVALAGVAQSIRDRANTLLVQETESGPLRQLHKAFKEALIHDLKSDDFADMYAQTIAYGLLSARISRQSGGLTTDDAALIAPPTSPFLREILGTFLEAGGRKSAGGGNRLDFDELGVSAVVDLLRAADMEAVLDDFDKTNPNEDPVIHFYELFLREYDPALRVKRGVFYTPRPVVAFIVRSVDEALRTAFGLEDGLASTATWADVIAANLEIKLPVGAKLTDPFVRILDPATGTGTFLVECIDLIHKTMVKKWSASGKRDTEIKLLWNAYVPNHLLPRLTGFELMMAPYAIAHVKLGLKLVDTGYVFPVDGEARAQIYLTNALEPAQDLNKQLAFMSEALAYEAKAANESKGKKFTVVVGNPPYASLSSNLTKELRKIVDPYRSVDGVKIKERNMLQFEKNIQDDYIKFIRFSQSKIEKSLGVVGLVTNHGYIDGITLRGVRCSLSHGADILRILDLHGNSNKNESYYSGNTDSNVFDIKQGVAILLLVRGGHQSAFGFGDVWGSAEVKEKILSGGTMTSLTTEAPSPSPEKYDFRPIQSDRQHAEWSNWSPLDAVFPLFSTGVETGFDEILQSFDRQELLNQLRYFDDTPSDQLIEELEIEKGHSLALARAKPNLTAHEARIGLLQKAPFDFRPTLLHKPLLKTNSFKVMVNISSHAPALVATRQTKEHFCGFAISSPCGHKLTSGYDRVSVFPLNVLPSGTDTRTLPNIAPAFANRAAVLTGLAYDDCVEGPKPQQTALVATRRERGEPGHSFEPRGLFDWTYAVLHSPAYRSRYADYLKSDFARVPMPGSRALFEALVPLGTRLVALHLLDTATAPELADPKPVRFVGSGEPRVAAKMPEFKAGRVYINAGCWFQDVPERAWSFHIGGYQPAQKWLKDRAAKGGKKASNGRVLTAEDVLHYRRMIMAMDATIDLMAKIDKVIENHGGWPDAFRGMVDD